MEARLVSPRIAAAIEGLLGKLRLLRALRAQHRRDGRHPDGHALALGLRDYSARGMAYVRDLQRLIRAHKLDAYDDAQLAQDGGVTLVHVPR